VCHDCSPNRFILPFGKSSEAVRVCASCEAKLLANNGQLPGKHGTSSNKTGDSHSQRRHRSVQPAVEYDSEHSLSPWLYAFKPFSEKGKQVGIGRVYAKVIRATNLPKTDTLGKCDPYVLLSIGDAEQSEVVCTSIKKRTLNPVWNEEFVIPVYNGTESLDLELFDHDELDSDDCVGSISIPLSALSHQAHVEAWFDIHLEPSWIKQTDKLVGKKLKQYEKKKQGQNRGAPNAVAIAGDDETGDDGNPNFKPRVKLALRYTFSKVGEFFSHFTPSQPPPPPEDEFNIEKLYANYARVQDQLWPVIVFFQSLASVFTWHKPYVSAAVLVSFVYVCLNLWVFPVLIQLLLIRYMLWQYLVC
jgi:C2 domain